MIKILEKICCHLFNRLIKVEMRSKLIIPSFNTHRTFPIKRKKRKWFVFFFLNLWRQISQRLMIVIFLSLAMISLKGKYNQLSNALSRMEIVLLNKRSSSSHERKKERCYSCFHKKKRNKFSFFFFFFIWLQVQKNEMRKYHLHERFTIFPNVYSTAVYVYQVIITVHHN